MDLFHLISIVIVLSAAFAYVNFRVLKLPPSIGLMLVSLLFSLLILVGGLLIPQFKSAITLELNGINFGQLLLEGMLSFMLFAGAINIKYEDLKSEKLSIVFYSTISVLISTAIVGLSAYYILNFFGWKTELLHCFLFGALISPTDPIAVLSILKGSGISKSLQTTIAGESLFNDGVAVVVFTTLLELAQPNASIDLGNILLLFTREAVGGIILGIVVGYIGYRLFRSIDNYQVEVLLSLAIVMGGYTMAHYIHVSGPLAMVAAGLITGNSSKTEGMSDITADYIETFWELIDEILNAILFVLIGLELLVIHLDRYLIGLSAILILVILLTRYISVWIPSIGISLREKVSQRTLVILTWGGLRGGISIALALSIPASLGKELWVTLTYAIVCFSIIVQGLTVGKVSKYLIKPSKPL